MKKILISTAISATIMLSSLTSVALAGYYQKCPSASELQQNLTGDNVTDVIFASRVPYCQYIAEKTAGQENCQAIIATLIGTYHVNGVKCDYRPLSDVYKILFSRYRG